MYQQTKQEIACLVDNKASLYHQGGGGCREGGKAITSFEMVQGNTGCMIVQRLVRMKEKKT